jgi:predicted Zn-dependent protease
MAICRKQLASDPDNTYCRMILAQSQARLGQKDEALENAAKAASAETGNGGITVELARTRALCGDAGGALVALASALNQPMGPSVFEIKADPHFAGIDLSQLPADK